MATAIWPATSPSSNANTESTDMERTALSALARLLDSLSIEWTLIGALAANRYRASPRLTHDIDLLLADTGPGLDQLESALNSAGWSVRRADAAGELLRLRHAELGVADLIVAGTQYQLQALRRAHEEPIGEAVSARVLTPEDVILHKLIAGRSQDIADIEAIIEGGVPLDERYLAEWARYWDVAALWESLRGKR
jgi:hypothetical protein